MTKCITHKKCYATQALAEDALIEAHIQFDYASGHGPVAVYKCDDCGEYHLTSRGPQNEKLSSYLKDGHIQRQKEANRWLDRLKK